MIRKKLAVDMVKDRAYTDTTDMLLVIYTNKDKATPEQIAHQLNRTADNVQKRLKWLHASGLFGRIHFELMTLNGLYARKVRKVGV